MAASTYTLYTARRSGAASVEVLVGVLKLDIHLKDAAPWTDPPGPYLDELRRINPLGQLPTLLTPAGELLTESVAVLWTLAERHPCDWLPPQSTASRAQCLRWMQFASSVVYNAVGVADYPDRWTTATDDPARQAVQDAAVQRMRLGWALIADDYTRRGAPAFFLDDRPLLCDIYLANLSRWWKMRDWVAVEKPAFHALMQRVDALPEVAPVWARHWGERA
jgi:GST-like protein